MGNIIGVPKKTEFHLKQKGEIPRNSSTNHSSEKGGKADRKKNALIPAKSPGKGEKKRAEPLWRREKEKAEEEGNGGIGKQGKRTKDFHCGKWTLSVSYRGQKNLLGKGNATESRKAWGGPKEVCLKIRRGEYAFRRAPCMNPLAGECVPMSGLGFWDNVFVRERKG